MHWWQSSGPGDDMGELELELASAFVVASKVMFEAAKSGTLYACWLRGREKLDCVRGVREWWSLEGRAGW